MNASLQRLWKNIWLGTLSLEPSIIPTSALASASPTSIVRHCRMLTRMCASVRVKCSTKAVTAPCDRMPLRMTSISAMFVRVAAELDRSLGQTTFRCWTRILWPPALKTFLSKKKKKKKKKQERDCITNLSEDSNSVIIRVHGMKAGQETALEDTHRAMERGKSTNTSEQVGQ